MDTRRPAPQKQAQTQPQPVAERPLRAHAQRNRDALLAVAREAFEAGEVDLRIEEIARRAGVGVGTLYRHFSTRGALVEAVYHRRVEDLCATAPRLLATRTPHDALGRFLRQLITHSAASSGMASALDSLMTTGSPVFAQARTAMTEAIASIMKAGVAAGDIRADVTAQTLFQAMGGICTTHDRPGWETGAHAVVRLLLDGLRPQPTRGDAADPPR